MSKIKMSLYVDGIDADADQIVVVRAWQYAFGTIDGCKAVYRRMATEAGSYGGWRWEAHSMEALERYLHVYNIPTGV